MCGQADVYGLEIVGHHPHCVVQRKPRLHVAAPNLTQQENEQMSRP